MKICKQCNKEFEPIHLHQLYCSLNCKKQGKSKRQKELYKLKKLNTSFSKQKIKCKRCNKEFTPIKGQLYCSKECVRLHKNETRHKHTKIKSQQTKNSTYIQSTIIHKNFQYNGVFISLQNSGNAFSWNAYKNNKLILKSASTFTSVMECIRDAKRAF